MTTDSPADIQADLDSIDAEINRLLLVLQPDLRDWAVRTERWHRTKWRGAVLSATGIDLNTILGPQDVGDTVQTVIQRNVALMKDIDAQAQARIADAVFRGLTNATPARAVAAQVQDAVAMAKGRATRVASDQLTKMTAALDTERRQQAGVQTWMWRHSGKLHPRSWHKARNGVIYSDDPSLVGEDVDGQTAQTPPPAGDRCGQQPFCGCRAQAVLVL